MIRKFLILATLFYGMVCSAQPSVEKVKAELLKQDVKFYNIVLAQSILETGWYKCSNCSQDGNNIFGFYWKGKYKSWSTWQESVTYYKNWQSKWYKGGDYYTFLKKKGYAQDPNYISKLKRIVKMIE